MASLPPTGGAKVTFLGVAGVGKTSIIHALRGTPLSGEYSPTVAGEVFDATAVVGDRSAHLSLWDTAGQERFNQLVPMCLRNARVVVLMFAPDYPHSFASLNEWRESVRQVVPDAVGVLVGNKIDLADRRIITVDQAIRKAEDFGMEYLETSAVTRSGVDDLLYKLGELALAAKPPIPAAIVRLDGDRPRPAAKPGGCCG